MQGFDNKALILFPTKEFYDEKGLRYRYELQTATCNLVKYLRSIGMEPQSFLTDDLARELPNLNLRYISTLTRGDLFFVTKNCGIPKEAMGWDMVQFEDIVSEIEAKDKLEPGISVEDRFEHVLLRDKRAITSIIPTYKVVTHFCQKGSTRYRVVVKPNGGKIRLLIDSSTFKIRAFINNSEENPIDLLGVGFGNKSLTTWEV